MMYLGKDLFMQLGSCAEIENDDENVWGFKVKALNLHFYNYLILYYTLIRQNLFLSERLNYDKKRRVKI